MSDVRSIDGLLLDDIEAFIAYLCDKLGLVPSSLSPDEPLEDLGFDSLLMMEVLAVVESLGIALPEELIASLGTIRDIHHYYVTKRTAEPIEAQVDHRGGHGSTLMQVPSQSRHTRLRTLEAADYEFLYRVASSPESGHLWRLRGQTKSPADFAQQLWSGVLAQFLIVRADTGAATGLVGAYGADLRSGFASLSLLLDPRVQGDGWPFEGAILFLEHVFSNFALRKLYIETLDLNLPGFSSALGRYVHEEGVLREHEFFAGRYWDLHLLVLPRNVWERNRTRLLESIGALS